MIDNVYICDGIRTPIGRYGGGLSGVRADDLAAIPISALMQRNPDVDWSKVDDVVLGCANQAGEDNRNVARMASLLAGLPESVPGSTINRLCGSGMNAVGICANSIASGSSELMIAGGVESMSRAPFVIGKSESAYGRGQQMYDTTMGWRFINPRLKEQFGTDTMPETAENLSKQFSISRYDQDQFAFESQQKAAQAQKDGRLGEEIVSVNVPVRRGEPLLVDQDEHPRVTTPEKLSELRPIFKAGTITAGNASGINDGAAAMLLASSATVSLYGLQPRARVIGMAVAGVAPRTMGIGPVAATKKLLGKLKLSLDSMDIIEINEAFAAQVLACTRQLGLASDDPRLNPQGGAIALGHPLGMSGVRLVNSVVHQLTRTNGRYALCAMCIGVGQGIAVVVERCD